MRNASKLVRRKRFKKFKHTFEHTPTGLSDGLVVNSRQLNWRSDTHSIKLHNCVIAKFNPHQCSRPTPTSWTHTHTHTHISYAQNLATPISLIHLVETHSGAAHTSAAPIWLPAPPSDRSAPARPGERRFITHVMCSSGAQSSVSCPRPSCALGT